MKRTKLFTAALFAVTWLAGGSAWAQHDGDHSYTNGICTIEGCTDKYQAPALVDDWYELTNAGNVEWISDYVQNVAIDPKVKMMNDIDFTGVEHTMIGRSDARKFNGIFDGQGHRITNLVLNYGSNDTPNAIGFFAWVRGGSTIKNLIMDKTCYFEGKLRVAAFVGVTQVASGGPVRIENCVNEANVQGHTGATGGFIGCRNPKNLDTPQAIISGCVNLGNILCDVNEAAAFVGWANSASNKHIVENSYNLGNISSDGNKRGFIRGDNLQITNSYDFGPNKANNSQNVSFDWTTDDPVASGELAFHLNYVADAQVLYQTLGTGADDAYPVPFSTSGQVYAHGNYRCDGVALPGTTYNNIASGAPNIPPHNYSANGICQNEGCTAPYQAPELVSEWYELKNAGNVEWLSNAIANGGGAAFYAKLMNDIDFLNIENLHNPLGPTKGSKFKGVFDGQGYSIKNMIINRPTVEAQGFFGWLQGNDNTTIKNLIIDSSCKIIGANKCGGLAGASQNSSDVAKITIENVVNEADVTVSGQDAAGIVGGEDGGKATYYIHNVVNTGTITSTHQFPYAGALFCFQERGAIENFLNLGKIVGHDGGNIGRFSGTWTNVVDLSETDNKTQSVREDLTPDDIVNGKLAYVMGFKQLIGTDKYPSPLNAKEVNYVGDAGYATMYDAANDWALNGDATAYIAAFDGDYLQLTEVEDVPAGAAVILKGSYYNKLATTATSDVIANDLLGTDADTGADGTMYVLAQPEGEEVGFYLATGTIAAGKAYYKSTSGVKAFYFGGGDATGISDVNVDANLNENGAIYNIAGQRLNKVQKGINIINGKKVLY